MSNPKPKTDAVNIQTPFGVAAFPHLNKPDEYKGKLEYKVRVFFNVADPGVAEFMQKVEEVAERFFREKVAEFKPKPGKKKPDFKMFNPVAIEYAEDGETKTGRVSINAKMSAAYKDKTGVEVPMQPGLFDAKGNRIDPAKVAIWGGSEVRLQCKLVPFLNDAAESAGATFKLQQVQIRKLRQGGAGQCAFGAVDGDEIGGDDDDGDSGFSGQSAGGAPADGEREEF
jgi:hypothetical protein